MAVAVSMKNTNKELVAINVQPQVKRTADIVKENDSLHQKMFESLGGPYKVLTGTVLNEGQIEETLPDKSQVKEVEKASDEVAKRFDEVVQVRIHTHRSDAY